MATQAKTDKYEIISARLIELIEQGTLPWRKEWKGQSLSFSNLVTGNVYKGGNIFSCLIDTCFFGYNSPYFLTHKQAREKDWLVKKGSKATNLSYYTTFSKEVTNNGETTIATFPVAKWFSVFNIDSIDDSQAEKKIADLLPVVEEKSQNERHAIAEKVIASQLATINHGGDSAYYQPDKDYIQMPHLAAFSSSTAYYSTHFHELVHWSGHPTRLDRDMSGDKKSGSYAFEELIAELGAVFITHEVGISYELENHASYLSSWLKQLKEDKMLFFKASRKASSAAKFLLEKAGMNAE
jgi:antirestriction protein ArdC